MQNFLSKTLPFSLAILVTYTQFGSIMTVPYLVLSYMEDTQSSDWMTWFRISTFIMTAVYAGLVEVENRDKEENLLRIVRDR